MSEVQLPVKILDRQRLGIMVRQAPQLRRYREGDLDEIVEVGVARHVAQATDIVGLQRAQGAETVEHHPGLGTEHIPAHVEQPTAGGVKEEVDCFRLGDCAVASKGQRINAKELVVVGAPDQRLEFRDDARAPGARLLHLGHLALEKTIVDCRHARSSTLPRDSLLKNQRDANGCPRNRLPAQQGCLCSCSFTVRWTVAHAKQLLVAVCQGRPLAAHPRHIDRPERYNDAEGH